jgi:hypothetical protein
MDYRIHFDNDHRRVSRLFDPNEFHFIHDDDIEEELDEMYRLANESNYLLNIKQSSIPDITVIHNEIPVSGGFECPICYDVCDKNVHVLTNCNHEFCADCMSTIINHSYRDNKDASCPLCRQECTLIETASCQVFESISIIINNCDTIEDNIQGEDGIYNMNSLNYFDIADISHVFDDDYMYSPTSVARVLSPEFDNVSLPLSPEVVGEHPSTGTGTGTALIRYSDDDLDLAAILMEIRSLHHDMDME